MSAVTLLHLFNERRTRLGQELDGAQTLEDASRVLARHLEGLERAFVDGLGPSRARLAGFLLEALRAILPILTAATRVEVVGIGDVPHESPSRELLPTILTVALAALLFVSLLSVGAVPALLALVLLALVGRDLLPMLRSLSINLPFAANQKSGNELRSSSDQAVKVRADGLIVLRFLGDALDVLDRTLGDQDERVRQAESRTRAPLEDTPEVVDLMQELLGEALLGDATNTVKTAKERVPQVLRTYGLRAVPFKAGNSDAVDPRFVYEPSVDQSNDQHIMVTPAIVTEDGSRVVRVGRVVEPATR